MLSPYLVCSCHVMCAAHESPVIFAVLSTTGFLLAQTQHVKNRNDQDPPVGRCEATVICISVLFQFPVVFLFWIVLLVGA